MTREKQQESPHIRRHLGEVSARPPPPLGPSGRKLGTKWRRDEESTEAERGGDLLTREQSDGLTPIVCLLCFPVFCASSNLCLSPFFFLD